MPRRNGSLFGLFLLLSLMVTLPAWGQAVMEATLTGTVTSGQDRIPGATVKITGPSLIRGERMVMSDTDGRFVFLGVPPGIYTVSAMLEGFKTYTTKGVQLHAGDKVAVNVAMQMGAFQEAIVVTGAAPVVDTKSAEITTTFSDQMLEKLPTSRNAFYDLALTAPGMSSVGANESWLSSPSAYGSAANENVFLVNGVNATNPRGAPWGSLVQVNYDTVEEVKILSLGTKAEYGSFSGAAIDVLTKSGSNDLKGNVSYYSQLGEAADNAPSSFKGRTSFGQGVLYADPNDIITTIPKSSWEGSATAGGSVVRDRLWFYAGYNNSHSKTDTPLFEPLATWKSALYDLKLTGDLSAKQRGWLAYHYEDSLAGNNTWGQTWDSTMAYDQGRKNHTLQAQYQWVASDRSLFSAKYLGFRTEEHPTPSLGVGHPGYINWWKWIGTQSIGVNGDFPYVEKQKSNRQTLQADGSHYAANFLGDHELKYGVQYTRSHGDWVGGYFQGYANFSYPYPWDYGPATNWWWNGPADWQWGTATDPVFPIYNNKTYRNPWLTVRQSDNTGLFFDDTWSVNSRLSLNVGVRWDRQTAKYGEGEVYEMPKTPSDINNPTLLRKRAGSDNIFDFKNWSPRLGVAWVLTDDNKTVLSAHVGRYYAPLGVESLRRFGPDMEPSTTIQERYDLKMKDVDANKDGLIQPNEVIIATRLLAGRKPTTIVSTTKSAASWALQVAPGTTSPYTDQFEISLQRQVGRDISIEGTYIFKKTNDLISLRPYNTATGEFYEWTSSPYTTWTGFKTKAWQIALKDYNADGKADIDDAKWVLNHINYRAVNAQNFSPTGSANRQYQGVQFVLTKRYTNRWQALGSVNYTVTTGLAPRTVSQDWYIDGPMIMDTPFGSTINDFQNNTSGPLPMTPKWMVKLSGSYTAPVIETDFSMRYRYDSGRAFWPVETLPAFATWMPSLEGAYLGGGNLVATDPTHPDRMPKTSILDFGVAKTLNLGKMQTRLSLDLLNALNTNSPNRIGWKQADYGRVYSVANPRTVRGGVKFIF